MTSVLEVLILVNLVVRTPSAELLLESENLSLSVSSVNFELVPYYLCVFLHL